MTSFNYARNVNVFQPAKNPDKGTLQRVGIGKAVANISVPSLLGQTLAQAQTTLATLGLGISHTGLDTGTTVVVTQSPVAATMVPKGTTVGVYLGAGNVYYTLFGEHPPYGYNINPTEPITHSVGTIFRSITATRVVGARWFKTNGITAPTLKFALFDFATGLVLGTPVAVPTNSKVGWTNVLFVAPISIVSDKDYMIVAQDITDYGHTPAFFRTPFNSGELTSPISAGRLGESTTTMPNLAFNDSNYWVDVICEHE